MKKKYIIIISVMLTLTLLFAGCARSENAYDMSASEPQMKNEAVKGSALDDGGFGMETRSFDSIEESEAVPIADIDLDEQIELSEKIIYNVHASLLCDDVLNAVKLITEKVESLGGYVSYANTYKSDGFSYANIEIRVPSENLDIMEGYSHEIGDVEEYTMSSNNITENYYDILARLEHNLVQEAQLIEIMKEAKTIEETLLVRVELDRVQERIESYKGRMRVWDSLVDYSTITYNLRPTPTLDNDADDTPRIISLGETWRAMKRGFEKSWIAVLNFFSFLLRAAAVLAIPLVICGIVAVIVVILVRRGGRKKKDGK